MESYKSEFNKNYNNQKQIEKNLDKIIIQRMRGESSYSPFKYTPIYQQDQFSRLILQGNRSIINPNSLESFGAKSSPNSGNKYFGNIQHQYLNQENSYNRIWNINNKDNSAQHEGKYNDRNNTIDISNTYQSKKIENKPNSTTTNDENLSIMSNRGSQVPTNINYSVSGRNSPKPNKFAELGQNLISTPSNIGKSPEANKMRTPITNINYRVAGQGINNYHYYNPGKY